MTGSGYTFKRLTDDEKEFIRISYLEGATETSLAKKLHRSKATISDVLHKANVQLRHKPVPKWMLPIYNSKMPKEINKRRRYADAEQIMDKMIEKYGKLQFYRDMDGALQAAAYREACYTLADILGVNWKKVKLRLKVIENGQTDFI